MPGRGSEAGRPRPLPHSQAPAELSSKPGAWGRDFGAEEPSESGELLAILRPRFDSELAAEVISAPRHLSGRRGKSVD